MRHDDLNHELLARYAPRPGRRPLLPELSERQKLALLCRVLSREGYNDHIAGHITLRLGDGSYLANPWELTWGELTASDILRLDERGGVIEGDWNITPAIGLHLDVHRLRHDVRVVIHNHPEWSSVWSATGRVPPVYDQTSALVDTDPVVYDEYRGTVEQRDLGQAAASALGQHKWALLANHGALVVGASIRQAHLRAITLEWRCRLAWRVQALGGGHALGPEVVQATGARTDQNGFPFLWEAMCREEIRRDPTVLD
ncbi:MAG: class II aldolase/adducin family protein [Proteobacteria bacterium]|nr:class II aldolase/adducin family protein [Pseudomonadota bacterium]